MRVLVIGGSGFIGRYLVRRLNDSGRHDIRATYRSRRPPPDGREWYRVELTAPASLRELFRRSRPEVVVHLAAMADVGACERQPEVAAAVNIDATSAIAGLCRRHGAGLVFVSTEYVFDGLRGLYAEDDTPNPNTHYGRTKLAAEQTVAAIAVAVPSPSGGALASGRNRAHQHRLRLALAGTPELRPLARRPAQERSALPGPGRRASLSGLCGAPGRRHCQAGRAPPPRRPPHRRKRLGQHVRVRPRPRRGLRPRPCPRAARRLPTHSHTGRPPGP